MEFGLIRRCSLWTMNGGSKKLILCKKSSNKWYSTGSHKTNGFRGYLKSLKWFSIPASVGFAYIGYQQFRHIWERERKHMGHASPKNLVLKDWQVECLKLLPTRILSRCWGYLSHQRIPTWMRKPVYGAYVKIYDCNMDEAIVGDLCQFPTFSDFFKRKLRPESRPIDAECDMVSPVDGKVLHFGEIDSKYNMEQVKGVTYSLVSFLGPKHPFVKELIAKKVKKRQNSIDANVTDIKDDTNGNLMVSTSMENLSQYDDEKKLYKEQPSMKLYYCILYLAPGDYHWFHSPTEWIIEHRRHIRGHLFSVNPSVMKSVEGLFNFNERVILHGHWKHGELLMAAVGAYNVGSINLQFTVEKTLKTNTGKLDPMYSDRLYGAAGFSFKRGESIGAFDLGSSIVLVFTGPENLQFQIQPGQKIRLGENIATSR